MIANVFFWLGFIIGFLVAVLAWKGSYVKGDWKQDPRFKAILWIFVSSIVVIIGDWDGLFSEAVKTGFDKLQLVLSYVGGAVIGVILSLTIVSAVIFWKFKATAWLEFFMYGYGYLEKSELTRRDHVQQLCSGLANDRDRRETTLISSVAAFLESSEEGAKSQLCERILEAICSGLKPYISADDDTFKINANYMEAISFENASSELKDKVKYSWGNVNRYSHLLVLKQYMDIDHRVDSKLVLPVDNSNREGWLNRVLPGAPMAFSRGEALLVTLPIKYSNEVPSNIRGDIDQYFENQQFRNFLSIIIPVKNNDYPIGVVNIETNQARIEGYDTLEPLVKLVDPLIALLGLLIKCEGKS